MGAFNDRLQHDEGWGGGGGGGASQSCTAQLLVDLLAYYISLSCYTNTTTQEHTAAHELHSYNSKSASPVLEFRTTRVTQMQTRAEHHITPQSTQYQAQATSIHTVRTAHPDDRPHPGTSNSSQLLRPQQMPGSVHAALPTTLRSTDTAFSLDRAALIAPARKNGFLRN